MRLQTIGTALLPTGVGWAELPTLVDLVAYNLVISVSTPARESFEEPLPLD